MRHMNSISRLPKKAQFDHPSLQDSIAAFLSDPIGTLLGHFTKDFGGES